MIKIINLKNSILALLLLFLLVSNYVPVVFSIFTQEEIDRANSLFSQNVKEGNLFSMGVDSVDPVPKPDLPPVKPFKDSCLSMCADSSESFLEFCKSLPHANMIEHCKHNVASYNPAICELVCETLKVSATVLYPAAFTPTTTPATTGTPDSTTPATTGAPATTASATTGAPATTGEHATTAPATTAPATTGEHATTAPATTGEHATTAPATTAPATTAPATTVHESTTDTGFATSHRGTTSSIDIHTEHATTIAESTTAASTSTGKANSTTVHETPTIGPLTNSITSKSDSTVGQGISTTGLEIGNNSPIDFPIPTTSPPRHPRTTTAASQPSRTPEPTMPSRPPKTTSTTSSTTKSSFNFFDSLREGFDSLRKNTLAA